MSLDRSLPAPVEVRNLTIAYGRTVALDDITVAIPDQAVTGVIGPNGAGKTTLLHAIMGLLPVRRGAIAVFGQPIQAVRRRVAYVPQRGAVDWQFPVTVRDVALMGRYSATPPGRRPTAHDHALASQALEQVGMTALAERQIGALSGGQRQRAFIARALAQQADLLILDEPFSGIDAASQEAIFGLLTTLKTAGKAILLATHDLTLIHHHCDTVLCLNRRLIAFGPSRTTLRLDVLERTFGGRLIHMHEGTGVLLA